MTFEKSDMGSYAALPDAGLAGVVDENLIGRLGGLSHITMADQEAFLLAMAHCSEKCSYYYFPFLYSFARAPRQPLLWEAVDGSICVYILGNMDKNPTLRLYLPPFPFNLEALKWAEDRQRKFNGNSKSVVVWSEQSIGPDLMERGYRLEHRDSEYIYDGDLVRAADGSNFARLRKSLSRVRKLEGVEIRNYGVDDQAACLDLLSRWRDRRRDQGIEIDGYGYTRRIVQNATEFRNGILRGEVVLINRKLAGFSFGGPISSSMECIFIAISDHDIAGLGYPVRHSFVSSGPQKKLYNDGGDGGFAGLREVKMAFRPIEINYLYKAFLG